jgi:N-acetyl-gamma-glutamyl-phosphate reductase
MEVTVPLFAKDLNGTVQDIKTLYADLYQGSVVRYTEMPEGLIPANALSGLDRMEVTVAGNEERILLISIFDNLGKGASGAAIQNMNILLGLEETTGLVL